MGQPHGRHSRDVYAIEGEGVYDGDGVRALRSDETPSFTRIGPKANSDLSESIRKKVARAMTKRLDPINGDIPAGYTYLGQFVDHDMTRDKTLGMPTTDVEPEDLIQGRTPRLDLDSLYGAGPFDPDARDKFYNRDLSLKIGRVVEVTPPPLLTQDRRFDLPRDSNQKAVIPDPRNDENLAVAQTHVAMIRFHNEVFARTDGGSPEERFRKARRQVVLHYQWMLKTDYLPRICREAVVNDVFNNKRKIFDPRPAPGVMPKMPVEFSVAAFRLGHSMVRAAYDWNAAFPDGAGTLEWLFTFTGESGDLGGRPRLASNWIADWRRLYRFADIDRDGLKPPRGELNLARRIDTRLTPKLRTLPGFEGELANLAFRNLTRGNLLKLATGQQMATFLRSKGVAVTPLTPDEITDSGEGATLGELDASELDHFVNNTPLWFYILREAEVHGNGRLAGVGARIVVETFHRAIEGSGISILPESGFTPKLGPVDGRFTMMDLLIFAFKNNEKLLAPLGD